jgi:tRNA A-37 threonylcarbamoyl transferase component Bud32
MLGQTLGNFRVIEKMSEGGMGQLFLARHVAMDRRAVVKVLRAHLASDEVIVRRFLNEANAAAMIGHPGIVYVMDVGRLDTGSPYILMEYLEGESLSRRLKRVGMFDVPTALSIMRQVTDALAAAHEKGIIHRDLKPGNIFLVTDTAVSEAERVKLLDFGIAKLLTNTEDANSTRTDMIMGTPMYMSPEQCDGARNVDARSDLYSLGCILFQLVCGRPPFQFPGAGAIIAAHLTRRPPAPSTIDASIPPAVDALILRLLAKPPAERFQSARDLLVAIDELLLTLGPASLSGRAAIIGGMTGRMARLERGEPVTPAPQGGRRAPTAPPAPIEPGPTGHPSMTAQIGNGESMLPGSDQPRPERRRIWAILLGMVMALGAALLAWPWLQGDDQRASSANVPTAPPVRIAARPGADEGPAKPPGGAESSDPAATADPAGAAAPAAPPAASIDKPDPDAKRSGETATVAIEVLSRPIDAEVYHGGKQIGRTPYRGTFPPSSDELVFVIKKAGYEDQVVEIPAARDHTRVVELTRKRARRPSGGRRDGPRNTLRPEEGGPVDPFK